MKKKKKKKTHTQTIKIKVGLVKMGLDDVYDGRKQSASEKTLKNGSLIINTRRGSLKKGAKEVRVVIALQFGPEEIGWMHYN